MPSRKTHQKFQPRENARLALDYLTSMVDEKHDYLPYWLIHATSNPASAKHCRVDDAELVASWFEAIRAVRQMLDTDEGAEVEAGFQRHLMKSWGPKGLRYHEDYPWSHTNHSSFHEMSYILSALNRILRDDPGNKMAEKRSAALVRGMHGLKLHRKTRTFWSGDWEMPETVYEFPNDVYLRKGGWDFTKVTGRGEESIRNGMMLHALAVRADEHKDEVALDLAIGMANYILGISRYFNWKMEFFGHVHSAVWVASGLARLGRVAKEKRFIEKSKGIWDYVRSLSSSFGWVPEYAQWHPMIEEHCETCCIKDMIECASELIKCGYEDPWEVLVLYSRNQLVENQIKDGSFVATDNSIPDTNDTTHRDMDKRIVGGFSGGAEPNSISLKRFRAVAGCCVGTAPQALQIVWDHAVTVKRGSLTVNIPLDKTTDRYALTMDYPNKGRTAVTPRRKGDVAFRLYGWMDKPLTGYVNGKRKAFARKGGLAVFKNVPAGATVELRHPIRTRRVKEVTCGREFTGVWRGPDVVDMLPRGDHLRLYQREVGMKKYYPKPPRKKTGAATFEAKPTQQK